MEIFNHNTPPTVILVWESLREHYPLLSYGAAARLVLHDAFNAENPWHENPVLSYGTRIFIDTHDLLESLAILEREGS